MNDSSPASAGVVLAGVALAAAALPWGTAGVGPVENAALAALGAVAFVAFSLRRHDLLARGSGSLIAGLASLGVVGYLGLLAAGSLGDAAALAPSWWAVGFALVGGVGGVIAAYGDGRGLPASFGPAVRAASRSLAVGLLGLFAIAAWSSVLLSAAGAVGTGEPAATTRLAISAVALGLGTGTVALIYFQWTERTRSFLDFRLPSRRDLGYVVGGSVALLGLQLAASALFDRLGVGTAQHSVQQSAGGNPEVLLLLVPASWLIIGPGEELLYRNIVQKDLYDTFGDWGAVLVGSGVFALAHVPAYATGAGLAALLNTLVVILLLSLVLGVAYLRTGNATVSALIHGTYDAVVFAAMYVQLTGGA